MNICLCHIPRVNCVLRLGGRIRCLPVVRKCDLVLHACHRVHYRDPSRFSMAHLQNEMCYGIKK